MYRSNVSINDLINRFDVTNDDDFDNMTENVKYVGPSYVRKFNRRQSGDTENFGNDENRSLVKAYSKKDQFIDSSVYVKRTNVSMSGAKEFIKQLLHRFSMLLEMISKFPFPRMSVMSFGLTSLLAVFIAPRSFTERVLYPGFRILFTIIYPAYRSFKAVRNKNIKEYLKWLVFWIVYAFFTCFELVSDALLNWFPFYYEIKIIFLIWILGPSSRGGMKVYKNIIHPILVNREQEIDDIIQLAQDHGYMQVFRLSSKSVNYANKIIMQDTKTDSGFIVPHQLMKNMSLSNISDAGTIQTIDDNEEALQMRRYSIERVPLYGNNQMNFSFENLEPRRKPSFDYKYDDMMSSGYASPTSPYQRYPIKHSQHHQKGAFIEDENLNPELTQKFTPTESNPIIDKRAPTSRKSSINDLTEDEIILAYQKLQQMDKNLETGVEATENRKSNENVRNRSDEMYQEFLKWMEMKRKNEIEAAMATLKAQGTAASDDDKVKTNVTSCIDEKSMGNSCMKPNVTGFVDDVCVVKREELIRSENETNSENFQETSTNFDASSADSFKSTSKENLVSDSSPIATESQAPDNEKTESDQEIDFNDFKDAVSEDEDENKDFLAVPLIIREENDPEPPKIEEKSSENKSSSKIDTTEPLIPTVVEENITQQAAEIESSIVNAKMILTNDPLEIHTQFSSSSVSLASESLDGSENKAKRPAKHSKGRAPQPPTAMPSTSTTKVIEGYFYDELTDKHFKETEL